MKLSQIIKTFEERIPLSIQEKWDQCGLNLGSTSQEIKSVLFSYDICKEVIDYAVKNQCQLIVSHHPFRLKAEVNLNLDDYEGQMISQCIKHNIALYCSHTNHDNSADSLNLHYLKKLQLKNIKPLAPQPQRLFKLVVYVPIEHTQKVMTALFQNGAGGIGDYSECSFRSPGKGTFKGNENTHPAYGKKNVREEVTEERLEVLVEAQKVSHAVEAMKAAHPYEEVAYDLIPLELGRSQIGMGAYGISESGLTRDELVKKLKSLFQTQNIRLVHNNQKKFFRIGICTGSGVSLLDRAISNHLDLFITGDVKYHQAIEAKRHDLAIADVGHFYSEKDSVLVLKNVFEDLFGAKLRLNTYKNLKDPFDFV